MSIIITDENEQDFSNKLTELELGMLKVSLDQIKEQLQELKSMRLNSAVRKQINKLKLMRSVIFKQLKQNEQEEEIFLL